MRISTFIIALFCLLALVTAASAETTAKDLYDYHGFRYTTVKVKMLTPEEFMIMPWGWTPDDPQALKDIRDCGFNVAGFVAPEHVNAVKKAGLKCFVDDPVVSTVVTDTNMSDAEIEKRVSSMTAKFKSNPTVFGYYVMDEPSPPLFANLGRWAAAIHKASPSANVYINMLPGWGPQHEQDYLGAFVNAAHPAYISYDNYSLLDDGSVGLGFYMNLEAVRNVSLKNNIPFWNIILGNSHFRYAEVTQGGLYLQAYATLAYGGKGISYFTYFSPLIGNYRNAAIDQFLQKSPTWDMIRRVNMQIHELGPTYLKLKSINVFHTQNVPQFCSGMDSSKLMSEVSGGDFLVGEFLGPNNTPFIMIVNKDISKSHSFGIRFKEQGTVMMTNPYTGETKPFGGENGWLAPGDGMLLSLKK